MHLRLKHCHVRFPVYSLGPASKCNIALLSLVDSIHVNKICFAMLFKVAAFKLKGFEDKNMLEHTFHQMVPKLFSSIHKHIWE